MKNYQYNERHDRVVFSGREVVGTRPVLAQVTNPHPTFQAIRERFMAETVNISRKQADVINLGLRRAGLPQLEDIAAQNALRQVSYRGTKESAVRSVMLLIGTGGYGDWRHGPDAYDLGSLNVLEVSAGDATYYLGFTDQRDLESAVVALDGAGWLA